MLLPVISHSGFKSVNNELIAIVAVTNPIVVNPINDFDVLVLFRMIELNERIEFLLLVKLTFLISLKAFEAVLAVVNIDLNMKRMTMLWFAFNQLSTVNLI